MFWAIILWLAGMVVMTFGLARWFNMNKEPDDEG